MQAGEKQKTGIIIVFYLILPRVHNVSGVSSGGGGGGGTHLGMHSNQKSRFANQTIRFVKRVGPDPHANGAQTVALSNCPDILELESGDYAVIGIDITDRAKPALPPTAGCGPDERVVLIPRNLLVGAKGDIP